MRKIAIVSLAALALGACTEIPTGHRGVEVNFGEVVGAHSEGLVWYNPMTTDIELLDVRQLKWDSKTEAYTKDVQQATINFALTYSLNPVKVQEVYKTVGTDWSNVLIPQVVEQSIKDVIGQSEAVKDTINNRPAVQSRIITELRRRLGERHIIVHGFEIKDVSFSEAFESAVEAKQVAVEKANAAKNRTVQVEEEARQKVIAAEAEAKAMKIKTDALAGSPKLVEYEAVQKWDGKMPQYMFGGSSPFVSIPAGK